VPLRKGNHLAGDAARGWSVQSGLVVPLFDLLRLAPLKGQPAARAHVACLPSGRSGVGTVPAPQSIDRKAK
jgi:hypothetical protein